jgi:Amt family ammonium transporter
MVGGISGFMGAIVLGPRMGRFNADGTVNEMRGHDLTLALLGTLILWIGWYLLLDFLIS